MRLTAHRVVRPQTGETGLNAFCYLHGPYAWLDQPPKEIVETPGVLVNAAVEVEPPGNRVRSYLDVWAPDATPNAEIAQAIRNAGDLLEARPLPLRVQSGSVSFHFDADRQLALGWRVELEVLLRQVLAVRA
jgi:hypothetical protein